MGEESVADDFGSDVDFIDEDVEFRAQAHLELVGDEAHFLGLSVGNHLLRVVGLVPKLTFAPVVITLVVVPSLGVVVALFSAILVVALTVEVPLRFRWLGLAALVVVGVAWFNHCVSEKFEAS